MTELIPRVSDVVDLRLGLRICISVKFQSDGDDASLGSTLQEPLYSIFLGLSLCSNKYLKVLLCGLQVCWHTGYF